MSATFRVLPTLFLSVLCLLVFPTCAAAQTEVVLYTFTGQDDGAWPQAGLTPDAQGNLYGTTNIYGPGGYGTVFVLSPGRNWTFNTIHGFCVDPVCHDGAYPIAGVSLDSAGDVFGTTSSGGGAQSWGVVYELSPARGTWNYTRLRNFDHANSYPSTKVTIDQQGRLFGTTTGDPVAGGSHTVYELVPNQSGTWNHRTIHDFNGIGLPISAVAIDRVGNLYGMVDDNPGGIFQLSPQPGGTWTYKLIAPFIGRGDLVLDNSGNIFGTGSGVVFRLKHTKSGWIQTVLYTFRPNDGGNHSGLAIGSDGSLYGTSGNGGLPGCVNAYGCGSVFKLSPTPSGWVYTTLYQFTGGTDGGNPVGGVVIDQAGNLFGATNYGGVPGGCGFFGCGVLFEITP